MAFSANDGVDIVPHVGLNNLLIANPDLVERLATGAPLAEVDWTTVYASGPRGYSDYPAILGLLPLVWAKGASEIARHDVSTPVFVGMIAASSIGVFLIPMLYVTWQRLRERSGEMFARKEELHSSPAE